MKLRLNGFGNAQEAMKVMFGFSNYLSKSSLGQGLLDLVALRGSQINGCAYCLDMHWKDLRHAGESEERLYMLDAWREASCYSERERAALELAEALTMIRENRVEDDLYERVRRHFSERELVDLTMAVVAINGWNRINIAFRNPPGSYKPGAHAAAMAAAG